MPLIVNRINAALSQPHESIVQKAVRSLRISTDLVQTAQIHKISLDARRQDNIHYVCSVFVRLSDAQLEKSSAKRTKISHMLHLRALSLSYRAKKQTAELSSQASVPRGCSAHLRLPSRAISR